MAVNDGIFKFQKSGSVKDSSFLNSHYEFAKITDVDGHDFINENMETMNILNNFENGVNEGTKVDWVVSAANHKEHQMISCRKME